MCCGGNQHHYKSDITLTFTLTSLCIPKSSGLKLTYPTGDWSIHSISLGWILRPIHILSMLVILGKRVVMKSETERHKQTKCSRKHHQFTFHHVLWFYASLKKNAQVTFKSPTHFVVDKSQQKCNTPTLLHLIRDRDQRSSQWLAVIVGILKGHRLHARPQRVALRDRDETLW